MNCVLFCFLVLICFYLLIFFLIWLRFKLHKKHVFTLGIQTKEDVKNNTVCEVCKICGKCRHRKKRV